MLKSFGGVFGRNPTFNTIATDGGITVGNGNIVMSTAGTGIDFSATASPAGSAGELLADYEEGILTATLRFGGASTGITYSQRTGQYTKVGRLVCCRLQVGLTNKGSSTGDATIIGLPYAPMSAAFPVLVGYHSAITAVNWPNGYVGSTAVVTLSATNDAGTVSALTDADFANNSDLIATLVYMTA